MTVPIVQNKNSNAGWHVKPNFKISLHKRDEPVLEDVKIFLHVGGIYERGPKAVQYVVRSLKELESVINHKFTLKTKIRADFELILMVHEIMRRKEHLTPEGLRKIVAIRASMNLGLSEKLDLAFPDVVPVERPLVELPKIINPEWIAGFTCGEGCFYVKIYKSKTKVGFAVQLEFKLTQDERDEQLMGCLIKYFNCGETYKYRTLIDFKVTQLSDITNKIIPLFRKYPIRGELKLWIFTIDVKLQKWWNKKAFDCWRTWANS